MKSFQQIADETNAGKIPPGYVTGEEFEKWMRTHRDSKGGRKMKLLIDIDKELVQQIVNATETNACYIVGAYNLSIVKAIKGGKPYRKPREKTVKISEVPFDDSNPDKGGSEL